MKKFLIILGTGLLWCNVALAKILILDCNVGNNQTTFHIDTSNQTWIQEGTRRFETPQIAHIYSSKIFMHVEIWLANEERNYFNNSYNDNSNYEVSTIMYDIDRYSQKIRGQSFIMTKNNFINVYFKNLKKNKHTILKFWEHSRDFGREIGRTLSSGRSFWSSFIVPRRKR